MSYRDQVTRCSLCATELREPAEPYAGLLLCRSCRNGRSTDALLARGIHVQTVEETRLAEGHHVRTDFACGATTVAIPPLQATFSREGLLSRVLGRDLQTGDRLFDDTVLVRGDGPELAALLSREPVRFAVMDLVRSAQVEVVAGCVRTRAIACDVDELRLAVAAIAWGLSQITTRPVPAPDQPAPLPTLELLSRDPTHLVVRGGWFDLGPLAHLPGLKGVSLFDVRLTRGDLTALASLPRLTVLKLVRIPEVREVAPLAHLRGLSTLVLAGCPVEEIGPLAELPELRALNLGHTRVRDLTPLGALDRLEELHIDPGQADEQQLAGLRQLRPGLQILTS